MRIPAPLEHDEQVAFIQMVRLHSRRFPELELLYAVPNGGHRHPATAKRLQDEGVAPGVPDMCLPVPRGAYSSLYIEMKRIGNKPTPDQIEMHGKLTRYGNRVEVCYGAGEAWGVLMDYIKGRLK